MAVETIFIRHSENFRGLDKRTSDIKRTNDYATEIKNAELRISGAINKRKGFHINQEHYDSQGNGVSSYGTFTYKDTIRSGLPSNVEGTEGAVVDRLLKVSDDLYVLEEDNFVVGYEGEFNLWQNIILDSDTRKFFYELWDEGNNILRVDLGTGLDGTGEPISDLASALTSVELPVMTIDNIPAQIQRDANGLPKYPFELKVKNQEITSSAKLKVGAEIKLFGDEPDEFLTISNVSPDTTEGSEYDYIITFTGNSTSFTEATGGNVIVTTKYNLTSSYSTNITSKRAAFFDLVYQQKLNTATVNRDASGVEISRSAGLTKLVYKYWVKVDTVAHGLKLDDNNQYVFDNTTSPFNWTVKQTTKAITNGVTSYPETDVDVRSTEELENATFAQLNNVTYISNGISDVMKFDSQKIYRAGLPNAATFVLDENGDPESFNHTPAGGSATTYYKVPMTATGGTTHASEQSSGTTRQYKFVYEYTDAKGNVITSQASDPITVYYTSAPASGSTPSAGIGSVTLTVPPVTHPYLNWHLDPVNVDSNSNPLNHDISRMGFDAQSDNLVVKIYRTRDYQAVGVPGDFYLVNVNYFTNNPDRLNNCDDIQNQTYTDDKSDEELNNLLVYNEPFKRHDPPPKGKYITTHKNLLVVTGDRNDLNNVAYSQGPDPIVGETGSEYFPDDNNSVVVESPVSTRITGVASLRDLLYVFHEDSISYVSGAIDDPEGVPSVDLLTREGGIGCLAQSSIQEIKNSLIFLSNKGIYMINATGALQETSALIKPILLEKNLKRKRCVSFIWTERNIAIFCIPKEAVDNSGNLFTTEPVIVVFDFYNNAWLEWTNIDISGGASLYKDTPHFNSRVPDKSRLITFNDTKSTFDFCDHTDAIDFEYQTNWESLSEPSISKKFTRLKLFAQDTDESFETPGFDLTVTMQKDYDLKDIASMTFDYGKSIAGGWGISPWAMFPWGNNSTSVFKAKLPSTKAKCLKLVFSNANANENVLITNYEIEVKMPYRKGMKE